MVSCGDKSLGTVSSHPKPRIWPCVEEISIDGMANISVFLVFFKTSLAK